MCYRAKFVRYRSNGIYTRNYGDLPESVTLCVLPFKVTKVIATNTDRSVTYDFLLMFHIATMCLSRTVSGINGVFGGKSQFWLPPVLLCTGI